MVFKKECLERALISNRGKCTFFERPRPRSELHLRSLQHVRNNASPEHLYILES